MKVKNENGDNEERLKIARVDDVGDQKRFGIYYWDDDISNWTTSTLKDMLNGMYYESGTGDCYKNYTLEHCDFPGNGEQPKGLDDLARSMIDKEIIWNLAGNDPWNTVTAQQFYEWERGTITYDNYPAVWSSTTDVGNKFNGIALIYPSDYAYATNGGNIGRETCFKMPLQKWNITEGNYQSDCAFTDWLKPNRSWAWTLYPRASYYNGIFHILVEGNVERFYITARLGAVWPTIYLKSTIKILPNSNLEQEYGSIDNPFSISL